MSDDGKGNTIISYSEVFKEIHLCGHTAKQTVDNADSFFQHHRSVRTERSYSTVRRASGSSCQDSINTSCDSSKSTTCCLLITLERIISSIIEVVQGLVSGSSCAYEVFVKSRAPTAKKLEKITDQLLNPPTAPTTESSDLFVRK